MTPDPERAPRLSLALAGAPQTISVVIPTLGRPAVLGETLESIASAASHPREVLVVDADPCRSGLPVVERFERTIPDVDFRYRPSAPGIPRQRNAGLKDAVGDVVVFLDDDVVIDRDFFTVIAAAFRDGTLVGATGRVIEPRPHRVGGPRSRIRSVLFGAARDGRFTVFGYPRYVRHEDRPMDVEVMPGCCMSARRDLAMEIGFDEALPGYALGEDEDFAYRLSRVGRIRYLPTAVVTHKKLGFARRDRRAAGREVVINRSYLFEKNFDRTLRARIGFGLLMGVLLAHRIVNGDARGAVGLLEGGWIVWRRPATPSG
jgi:GT2 family glycosyltransferase